MAQTVAINLVLGSVIPGVDNACHVGGLVGGFLIGGAFALVPREAGLVKRIVAITVICVLAPGSIAAMLRAEPSEELALMREIRAAERAGARMPTRPIAATDAASPTTRTPWR